MTELEKRMIEHLILVEDYAVSNVQCSLVKQRTTRLYVTKEAHAYAERVIADFNSGFRFGRDGAGPSRTKPTKPSAGWKAGFEAGAKLKNDSRPTDPAGAGP